MPDWAKFVRQNLRLSQLRPEREAEIVEDIAEQLDEAYAEALQRGLSSQEAEAVAKQHVVDWEALAIELGRSERGRETVMTTLLHQAEDRDAAKRGRFSLLTDFHQDVHYALRVMRKSPGFTLVVILTLALGIGANTSIFSIVNAVLLRSLPYYDPSRLVKITFNNPGIGLRDVRFSVPELEDLKSRSGVFEEVSVVVSGPTNLTGAKQQPEHLEMLEVSPNYFSMLGTKPEIGRLFGPQDFALGFAEATVISDGLWRRSFGADPNVLGKRLQMDNDSYTIVGVVPAGFRHPGKTVGGDVEVWVTCGYSADPFPKPARNVKVAPGAIGRLKPGISVAQAQSKLTAMASELRADFPNDYPPEAKWSIEIQSLQDSLVGPVRPQLFVLMAAVVLVVLIASVNIANLLLARASGRQREMAMRMALGAGRTRLVRQMLTESLVLSLIAGAAGVLAAKLTLSFIIHFVPASVPRLAEVGVDRTVLLFALLISIFTGIIFGLAPAFQVMKADMTSAIREGTQGSGYSAKTFRLRSVLIVSELALAVVLMVGAGLLLRTFWGLLQENPGFNPSRVVTASIYLPVPNDPKLDVYEDVSKRTSFFRDVIRRMAAIPGIDRAAMTSDLPGARPATTAALVIDDRAADSSQGLTAEVIRVSPDYFMLMQCPLIRGRFFLESDESGKQEVAIIDETTARRYWSGMDPVGKSFRMGINPRLPRATVAVVVVGIVKDMKQDGLDTDGVPHIFRSIYQQSPLRSRAVSVVARSPLPLSLLESQIRSEIQTVDPALPVFNVRSMTEVIDVSIAPRRFSAELVGVFAAVAMLLSSIGIYGLLVYMVGQRSHEIGIRVALGAQRSDILKLILGKGLFLVGVGIAIGMALAAAAAPTIATLLYGVHPFDVTVFATVPLVLMFVAFLATYIPARRATMVDPNIALRDN
jgi:predicted permease